MESENCSFDADPDMQEFNDRRATHVLTKSSFDHSPSGPSDIKAQDEVLNSSLYEVGDLSVSGPIDDKDESDEEEVMEGVCFNKVNNMNQEQIAKLLSEMDIDEEPVAELNEEEGGQGQKNNQTNVKVKKGRANKLKKEPENNTIEDVITSKTDQKLENELIKEKPKSTKRGKKEKVDVKDIDSTENSLIGVDKETFVNKKTKTEKSKMGSKNKSVKTVLKEKVDDDTEKPVAVKGSTAGKSKRGKKNNTEHVEGGKVEVNHAEIAVLDNVLSQPKELLENTEIIDEKPKKVKSKVPKDKHSNGEEIENDTVKVLEIIDSVETKSLKPKRGKTTKVEKVKEDDKVSSSDKKEIDMIENAQNNEDDLKPLESTKKADLNGKPVAQTKKGGKKQKDDVKSEIDSNLKLIDEDKENIPAKSTKPNAGRGKQNKISENVLEDNKNQKEKSHKKVQESADVKRKHKSKIPEVPSVEETKTEAKPAQRSKTTKSSEDPKKKGNNTNMQTNENTKNKSNHSKAVTNSTSETLSKNKNIQSNKDQNNLQVEEPVVRRVLRKK